MPHMDTAAAPMTIRPALCDTLRWVRGWDTSQGCGPPALRDTWTPLWSLLRLWGFPGRWATCRSRSTTSLCALTYCNKTHPPLWALKTASNVGGLLNDLREKNVFMSLLLQLTQYYRKTYCRAESLLWQMFKKVQWQSRLQNVVYSGKCILISFFKRMFHPAVDNSSTELCSSCSTVLFWHSAKAE